MKMDDVKAVLGRVQLWPAAAQAEAVASLRAIEHEWTADDHQATPEDLAAIGEDDDREVAASVEVETTLRSFR